MTAADTIVPATKAAGVANVVEQVVDHRNVIGQDSANSRYTQHDEGRRRPEPGEAVVQMKVSSVGRAADNEHRQKHSEAGRSGERYAQNNG